MPKKHRRPIGSAALIHNIKCSTPLTKVTIRVVEYNLS